jgi:hypothetical protein
MLAEVTLAGASFRFEPWQRTLRDHGEAMPGGAGGERRLRLGYLGPDGGRVYLRQVVVTRALAADRGRRPAPGPDRGRRDFLARVGLDPGP